MGEGRPGGVRRALVATAAIIIIGVGSAGCGADPAPDPTSTSAEPTDSVRAAVDAFNATAGGSPLEQLHRLTDLVDPDRRDQMASCPAAASTVRFEPVYRGLRALGGDAATTTYALPTLIRIYTGDRLTGTDLTTLQLVVKPASGSGEPEAYLTPFCVS